MLHDDLYVCRLGDMIIANNVRDAYEVGCRGRKREQTTAQLIKQLKQGKVATGQKNVGYGSKQKISLITCDACGSELARHADCGITPCTFYYCGRCKQHGNRYELCEACHTMECTQGLGKHTNREPHPHFMKCQHSSIVRQRLLHYPPTSSTSIEKDVPDIRRVFCDYCGQLAGNCDEDDDIFICPRCPDDSGVRFELCLTCCQDFDRQSHPRPIGLWDPTKEFAR